MGSYNRSTNWAISSGAAFGFVPAAGISAYVITLLDVDRQFFYPGVIVGSSVGAGLKAGGSVSPFSPTFFSVSDPMYISDFDNSLCGMFDIGLIVGVGASGTALNIYGVPHSPGILILSGSGAGLAGGVTLSPLMYMYIAHKKGSKNPGCPIAPTADKFCGGSSKKEPNQSKNENQSKSPNQSK